jgi:fucose permease
MPALAELLIRKLSFRWTLGLLAILCLVPAISAGWADPQPEEQSGNLKMVLEDPILWMTALALVFYMPLEGVIGTWTTTYLTDLGFVERRAAWLLSAFWLSFLASRLLFAFLQQHNTLPPWSNPWVILGLALFSAMALGNLAGAARRESAAWGLIIVGAAFGPIFPTLCGIVLQRFPHDQGTAYGAMFAIGATGSLLLPPAIGAFARRYTVQRALGATTIVALLLAAVVMVLGLWLRV